MRTTKCYMMEESFSSSVICSLWWVKLQIDTTKLSSTKAISLWNKSCGRSLCCNKLSISTPGFRSLSLEVVQEPHVTLTRDIQELYFECLLVENVDDEVLAGTPLMGFNDIVVRPARRAFTLRGTLYEYGSNETKPPYTAVWSASCFLSPTDFYDHFAWRVSRSSTSDDVPAHCDYALARHLYWSYLILCIFGVWIYLFHD